MKKQKRSHRITTIRVPLELRESLQPYADIFETVIIPLIQDVSDEDILLSHITRDRKLVELISDYCGKKDIHEPHPVLMFYGLMLCCYHCAKEESLRNLSLTLEVITKARALIRVTYYHLKYYETAAIFLCG